jgi:uncharacterized protein (TIGR03435 family)
MPLHNRLGNTLHCRYVLGTIVLSAVCGVIAEAFLWAQPTSPRAFVSRKLDRFDIVSVKRNQSGNSQVLMGSSMPGGRWIMTNNFVTNLIHWAYPSETGEYINLPGWAKAERYDVEAKVEGESGILDRDSLRMPMRALLEERFKFAAHYESRQQPVFELTRVKPRQVIPSSLRRVDIDCDDYLMRQKSVKAPAMTVASTGVPVCAVMNVGGALRSGGITMSVFAELLTRAVDAPVRDRTALEGTYEFVLTYDNKPLSANFAAPSGKPNIFEALQTQLGLRLESGQAPVEILVIDRLERPTEN